MKNKKFCFALYERADQWVIDPLIEHLHSRQADIRMVRGFSYDAYLAKLRKITGNEFLPASALRIGIRRSKRTDFSIFRLLMHEKIYSRETRLLLKQWLSIQQKLNHTLKTFRPDIVIAPEPFRALHGATALQAAKEQKMNFLALFPLYYEWISTRPAFGAVDKIPCLVASKAYRHRLIREKISDPSALRGLLPSGNLLVKRQKKSLHGLRPKTGSYYLAALQNNPEQAIFISLLLDTFRRLPNERLVIKCHPNTKSDTSVKLAKTYKQKNVKIIRKGNILRHLEKCHALITQSSTSALLAVYLRKPVIIADFGPFFHELDSLLNHYRPFSRISNPEELARILRRLKSKKKRVLYIKRQGRLRNDFFKTTSIQSLTQEIVKLGKRT